MATEKEKKDTKDFSSKSIGELLEYMSAVGVLCDYYDNQARANRGQYYGEEDEAYAVAMEKFNKYFALKGRILAEFEKRFDELC